MIAAIVRWWASFYHPRSPMYLVYMAQQVEYDPALFMTWIRKLPVIHKTQQRKSLEATTRSALLVVAMYLMVIALVSISLLSGNFVVLIFVFALSPLLLTTTLIAFLAIGQQFNSLHRKKKYREAGELFKKLNATKIAILGSYGKTTAKEILHTLLSSKYNVAATPGNQNVLISHARWISLIDKDNNDFLVIEFGEFKSGDIASMSQMIKPDLAIITGYAPNHLDSYGSEEELKKDLASIQDYVDLDHIYVENTVAEKLAIDPKTYTKNNILGWRVESIEISIDSTTFTITKGDKKEVLQVGLIGAHLVPIIVLSCVIALEYSGLQWGDIRQALLQLKPHPHRMQPRLVNGAWIIDDTYNGNIEGVRAGLDLLASLHAKRKTYVTPGLVEQGDKTEQVHTEIGKLIAESNPDRVILMENSVRSFVEMSLKKAGYSGEVVIEQSPKSYYESLEHRLAVGDLVLMQNDWTDNYN